MPPLRFLALFARALRSRGAVVLALVAVLAVTAACQPTKQPNPGPPGPPSQYCYPQVPANAPQLQDAFNEFRLANTGLFVAADGSLPFRLPDDGRVLWFFGDTLVGLRKPGQPVNPLLGFMSNSIVIQEGNCFRPWYQPIPNPDSGQWIWPNDAIIQNNQLLVFGSHMQGQFGSFTLLSMDVARFSLPDLAFLGSAPLPIPAGTPTGEPRKPNYGENVTIDGAHVYAYGRVRQGPCGPFCIPPDHHFVARAQVANVLAGTWEFWGEHDLLPGSEWGSDPTKAVPMLFDGDMDLTFAEDEGPIAPFPVTKPNQYLGSALDVDAFGTKIQAWESPNSSGPWTIRSPDVLDITSSYTGPCPIAYGGQVVRDLAGVAPFALWSVNQSTLGAGPCGPYPSGFDAVLANADLYKAFFANPAAGSIP
jgi:hypothetical protein